MWRSVLCAVVLPFLVFSQAEGATPNLHSTCRANDLVFIESFEKALSDACRGRLL